MLVKETAAMNEIMLTLAMAVGLGPAKPAAPALRSLDAGSFRAHWKSALSGAQWEIRKDHDALYLERILADPALRDEHLTSLELHRGKKGYRGTERQVVGGAYTDRAGRDILFKCTFDWPAELALLTDSRLEIRVLSPPDNARIDFRKCTADKTRVWHTAVWIPE